MTRRRVWEMKKARTLKRCTFCNFLIPRGAFYWRKVTDRRVVKDLHCQGGAE